MDELELGDVAISLDDPEAEADVVCLENADLTGTGTDACR